MPVKRKGKVTKRSQATPSRRVRFRFDSDDDQSVETDAYYWMIHALHWHALLVATVGVLVIGIVYF